MLTDKEKDDLVDELIKAITPSMQKLGWVIATLSKDDDANPSDPEIAGILFSHKDYFEGKYALVETGDFLQPPPMKH